MEKLGLSNILEDTASRDKLEAAGNKRVVDVSKVKNGEQLVLVQIVGQKGPVMQVPLSGSSLNRDSSYVLDAGSFSPFFSLLPCFLLT